MKKPTKRVSFKSSNESRELSDFSPPERKCGCPENCPCLNGSECKCFNKIGRNRTDCCLNYPDAQCRGKEE